MTTRHSGGCEDGDHLDLAIDHYLNTEQALTAARAVSAHTRRHSRTRDIARTNQAAIAARQAHEHARDQLVHAALATRATRRGDLRGRPT